jgi:hypothetical protein
MRLDVEEHGSTVVLGPCPGCQAWQLDYDLSTPLMADYAFDPQALQEAVESILVGHLVECVHLQRAIGNNWISYV